MTRILTLSWEYPPLIEGGLARVVRKQAEGLVERDAEVHVLTRGGEESPAEELVNGVHVHRVREPTRPAELNDRCGDVIGTWLRGSLPTMTTCPSGVTSLRVRTAVLARSATADHENVAADAYPGGIVHCLRQSPRRLRLAPVDGFTRTDRVRGELRGVEPTENGELGPVGERALRSRWARRASRSRQRPSVQSRSRAVFPTASSLAVQLPCCRCS